MEPGKVSIPGICKKKYLIAVFNSSQCPHNIDPLLFSQLCVYYCTDVKPSAGNELIEGDCVYTESIATDLDGEVVYKKKTKILKAFQMGLWPQCELAWTKSQFLCLEMPC